MNDDHDDIRLGKAPVWINSGLMLAIVATTSTGVWQFASIGAEIRSANQSLGQMRATLSEIKGKLSKNADGLSAVNSVIAGILAEQKACDAKTTRMQNQMDKLETRVRDLEK